MIVIFEQNKVINAINFKIHYDFFMDIKRSNILEHRLQLSSFSLKIYNVNAGNRQLRFCEFCPQRRQNPLNSQSEARLY